MKDTKTAILEKSLELFSNRNYDAVSMSEICDATGLTKGAIYHYFKSKTDIYTAAIDFLVDKILSKLTCDCGQIGYFEFVKQGIKLIETRNGIELQPTNVSFPLKCVFMLYGAHRFYPDFEKVGEKVYLAHIALWERVLNYSINAGELPKSIDTANMARISQSISAGIFSKALLKYSQNEILIDLENQYMALYKLMKQQ